MSVRLKRIINDLRVFFSEEKTIVSAAGMLVKINYFREKIHEAFLDLVGLDI